MTSSSGDSAAPLDFHISSSCEDNVKLETEDCPLCFKAKRNFYCKGCIKSGDFYHSSSKCCERFNDKKLKLYLYMQEKMKAAQMIEKKLAPNLKTAKIESDIKMCNDKIRFLKLLIQDKKKIIAEKKEIVKALKEKNEQTRSKLPRYEDRVAKLKGFVKIKSIDLKEQEKVVANAQNKLMNVRKWNINQLVSYIFPITEVKPTSSDTVSALEEACRTAYVQGKWVFTNTCTELQHRIVAPTLPTSGDYSAYIDWVAANKDSVPTTNNRTDFNPAYNISAALTYTTQLVNMLAYYLDVRLPAKLCYSEFCNEMSKEKFIKRVSRLNWNVIHLCLSQNVNPTLLKPNSTLSNILCLLNTDDLGRTGALDVDLESANVLEEALRPGLETASDSEDSEDDSEHLSYEWEAVANTNMPEVEAGPSYSLASQQQVSNTSLLTSTAQSIASLWRGWATNR